ncbi:hypothetical protein HDV05_004161 [Chytridiales sp. JEL 0842]|nr:hypothetical protein HDV05_004161 [Chytridiales sp. JEL 0842]
MKASWILALVAAIYSVFGLPAGHESFDSPSLIAREAAIQPYHLNLRDYDPTIETRTRKCRGNAGKTTTAAVLSSTSVATTPAAETTNPSTAIAPTTTVAPNPPPITTTPSNEIITSTQPSTTPPSNSAKCDLRNPNSLLWGAMIESDFKTYEERLTAEFPFQIYSNFMDFSGPQFDVDRFQNQILGPIRGSRFEKQDCRILILSVKPAESETDLFVNAPIYSQGIAQLVQNLIGMGYGVSVRFMYEMNGGWFKYGKKPEQFKKAFQTVSSTIRAKLSDEERRQFVMFWSPNAYLGDNYMDYYPGDEHVEWAGLDAYWKGYGNPTPGEVEKAITQGNFYKTFCEEKKKVCGFGETGTDAGRGNNYEVKTKWIEQVYNKDILAKYPAWKVVVWFEYLKYEDGQTRDWYLALGDQMRSGVLDFFKGALKRVLG